MTTARVRRFFPAIPPVRPRAGTPEHGEDPPCSGGSSAISEGGGPQLTFFTASRAASVAVSTALRTLVLAAFTCVRATFVWSTARLV